MNRIRHLAGLLGGLALGMLLGSAPAFADRLPPAAWMDPPLRLHLITRTHVVTVGGMPGWQITLIAVGAALIAATLAMTATRARAAHQHAAASTTLNQHHDHRESTVPERVRPIGGRHAP
jgi:hypothetical protein